MFIKQLNDQIINRIAAGEVVARPASVVKELLENSIDAGATRIELTIENGGKTFIQVLDNGYGILKDELPFAISRHCTSKIDEDIHNIRTLGFRGEALPSIGSVAKLKIISKHESSPHAAEILVENGKIFPVRPASLNQGTLIEVKDLFHVVPARLKFLKTDRTELSAIHDIFKKLAMAYPKIHFLLKSKQKKIFEFFPQIEDDGDFLRIADILNSEFTKNCVYFSIKEDDIQICGYGSIPSYTCSNSLNQFCYINHRPIHDKFVLHAIKSAYNDFIPKDRYPYIVLFITMSPFDVDVNVHPTKSDVRFRDAQTIRSLIIYAIKNGLENAPLQSSSSHSDNIVKMLSASKNLENFFPKSELSFQEENISKSSQASSHSNFSKSPSYYSKPYPNSSKFYPKNDSFKKTNFQSIYKPLEKIETSFQQASIFEAQTDKKISIQNENPHNFSVHEPAEELAEKDSFSLGHACAQVHKNYIISQTTDSLIFVDQHAAHERIVYEALKKAFYGKTLTTQILLMPCPVNLSEDETSILLEHKQSLCQMGLVLEEFGPNTVLVRETPALLRNVDVESLVKDLAQEIMEYDTSDKLKDNLDHIAATMACHGSVRSGRILKIDEMNALLREMEKMPKSGTCNHGRPTFVELKLNDIEKLFKRR